MKAGIPVQRKLIRCSKLDSCKSMTILFSSEVDILNNGVLKPAGNIHLAESLDHFNVFEGVVTIYYENGDYMEVTRVVE